LGGGERTLDELLPRGILKQRSRQRTQPQDACGDHGQRDQQGCQRDLDAQTAATQPSFNTVPAHVETPWSENGDDAIGRNSVDLQGLLAFPEQANAVALCKDLRPVDLTT